MDWKRITIGSVGIVIAAIVTLVVIPRLLLNYWFFQSLGFEQVFLTNLVTQVLLFSVILAIALVLFCGVGKSLAKQITREFPDLNQRIKELEERIKEERLGWRLEEEIEALKKRREIFKWFRTIWSLIAVFVALIFAYSLNRWIWFDLLKFLNQTPFAITEPIFAKDLAFYFFSLPLINKVLWSALILGLLLMVVSLVEYLVVTDTLEEKLPKIPFSWRAIWAGIAVIVAGLAWFGQYSILYGSHKVLYGAGYTDVLVWKWFWSVLAVGLIIAAIFCLVAKEDRDILRAGKQPLFIVGVILALFLIFGITGAVVWVTVVEPNEFIKESPYIQNNIFFSVYGFSVDDISEQEYLGTASLNLSVLESPAVRDIRILDYRAVGRTLEKTQEMRTYYSFSDIDIDRYQIEGQKVQVLFAPREMNIEELPREARTWVNEKLIYTHGYAGVITPVNRVTRTGMPILLVQNIPPQSTISELKISQPQIYYGELTNHYVITNTRQPEFDYPLGDENVFSYYGGTGGIVLDSGLKRTVAALNFDFLKILLSDDIQLESRLHLYRNINERIKLITPYLYWEKDNLYFLDKEGAAYWMSMGMVQSTNCPYSEPGKIGGGKVNYIRDSVKAITDPLNGTLDFYVIEWDPMIRTYARIYPAVFKDISEMPEDFKAHLKYPEELFDLQVEKYNLYHMPVKSFYGKEDKWVVAEELYYGQRQEVESYNVLLPLEGEVQFVLMKQVTPKEKKVLIGWYAVCQDPPHYGKLILYTFPKGTSILGPLLVEAKINQDTVVSQAMTYWGGMGSRVIKGNLLVLPIEGALLYVEPLYIEAEEEEGAIPEAKLITAFYSDPSGRETVGLGITLEMAVRRAIVGESVSFDTLQREREIMTIEGVPEVSPEIMKVFLVIRDDKGEEIHRIEILPEQRVEIIPEIRR